MANGVVGALNGIRVLDFTRVLAGPFCTMVLADFGADVIKVEQPIGGDETRTWGPPWAGTGSDRQSAYYLSVNRNKRSLTLDLKSPEGLELARKLALQSHVLIENFKVGQMRSYGLDFARLHTEHPALVYCSISGYGQDGPYADRPGYDYVIQGQSGLMSITGPADGQPYKVGVAVSDVITGLFAANAIQAALHHRDQTGQGQHIDISLLDSQIAALVNVASSYLISDRAPERYGNGHPNIVPYDVFDAANGSFILAVGNDAQFQRCCELIGHPELADDERFRTNPVRVLNREVLLEVLRPLFAERTVKEWVDLLLSAGIPAGPINDIPTLFDDPHVKARGYVQPVTLPNGEIVDILGPTPRLSATPPTVRRPPPAHGQHTTEILRDMLGIDPATIAAYRQRGIV